MTKTKGPAQQAGAGELERGEVGQAAMEDVAYPQISRGPAGQEKGSQCKSPGAESVCPVIGTEGGWGGQGQGR
jgi:hypothetical protein